MSSSDRSDLVGWFPGTMALRGWYPGAIATTRRYEGCTPPNDCTIRLVLS